MVERKSQPKEASELSSRLKPMLLGEVDIDPRHVKRWLAGLAGWIMEPKWNGIRALVYMNGHGLRIETRSGKNITSEFPEMHPILSIIHGVNGSIILDGELISGQGKSNGDRQVVINRTHSNPVRGWTQPCTFRAFDLLHIDGENLTHTPLIERKRRLSEAIPRQVRPHGISITPYRIRNHGEFMIQEEERGFEGIVVKKRDSIYIPGARSRDWLKYKF